MYLRVMKITMNNYRSAIILWLSLKIWRRLAWKIRIKPVRDIIAEKFDLSEKHLCRLFRFAFNRTLADYIRSRKLTASIVDLFNTKKNVLNIAIKYCFEYEQTYIRALKREVCHIL